MLAAVALGLVGAASAAPAHAAGRPIPPRHPLDPSRVVQIAGPATVEVETKVTATVTVPTAKPDQPKAQALLRSDSQFEDAVSRFDRAGALHRVAVMYAEDPTRFVDIGEPVAHGQTLDAVGSGFLVGGAGEILTNAHVVFGNDDATRAALIADQTSDVTASAGGDLGTPDNADDALAQQGDNKLVAFLEHAATYDHITKTVSVRRLGPSAAETTSATIVKTGDEYPGDDLAVLRDDQLKGLPALRLAAAAPLTGSTVDVVGYPGAATFSSGTDDASHVTPSLTKGIVSAVKATEKNVPILQLDASLAPGNSGGPVLDDAGEVVGISVAGADSPGNFNFAIGIEDMRAFLTGVNTASPTGRQLEAAVRDLDAGWLRAARRDLVTLDSTEKTQPFAVQLHAELARRLAAHEPDHTPRPRTALLWALTVAAAVAVLGESGVTGVAVARWRRRRSVLADPGRPLGGPPQTQVGREGQQSRASDLSPEYSPL